MNVRKGFAALCLLPVLAVAAPEPQPALKPADVVQMQLDALRDNDAPSPNAGIATVFRFASPPNRAQTGPLPRFTQMIREGYPDLLNHRQSKLFPLVTEADHVVQPVEIVTHKGETFRYLFMLRQYDQPQGKCWMTDGVIGRPASAESAPKMQL